MNISILREKSHDIENIKYILDKSAVYLEGGMIMAEKEDKLEKEYEEAEEMADNQKTESDDSAADDEENPEDKELRGSDDDRGSVED